jgi:5-dehydro-2-deoxygluconokinase
MKRAGAKVGLISALSDDPVGEFVRKRLETEGIELQMMQTTYGDERTSLAIAEVRQEDCEVVIYRNNPADLRIVCNDDTKLAITQSSNLVITGTSLIEADSRKQTLKMMVHAQKNDCKVWLDLDYRPWNWPDQQTTRLVYQEAAEFTNVLVGNEEEFKILQEDINIQISQCVANKQLMILKRGKNGCSLFFGNDRLDAGIYNLPALKPYGSGDAFLGNVIINYMSSGDWQLAIEAGSAAAALVVSKQGCASAMPKMEEIELLQKNTTIKPKTIWS